MASDDKTRIGFVGCGGISAQHMKGIEICPELKVVACADIIEEKARNWAEKWGVEKVYTDWKELVKKEEIDILLFATWPSQHLEQVTAAAELGVPAILCEKSLALSHAEGAAMAEACKKSGTLLMEAFMYRHGPRTKDFMRRVHEGELGEVRYGWACFSNGSYENVLKMPPEKKKGWRHRKETGGGIVWDFTCYCVNFLRGAMQRNPKRVSVVSETCPEGGYITTMHAIMDYGDSVVTHIESSMRETVRMEAQIVGRQGTLMLPLFLMNTRNNEPPPMRKTTGNLFQGNYEETYIPTDFENPYALQLQNLARALKTGEPLGMPLEETLDNLKTIDALVKAAETGQFEEVAP
jgi:predicted dehydrogenase